MPKWQNWSGLIEAKPSSYRQVYSAQEAAGLAKKASQTGPVSYTHLTLPTTLSV